MTYSIETKVQAVSLYRAGKSWFSVCFTTGITQGTLYTWLKQSKTKLQSDPDFEREVIVDLPFDNSIASALDELIQNETPNHRLTDDMGVPLT